MQAYVEIFEVFLVDIYRQLNLQHRSKFVSAVAKARLYENGYRLSDISNDLIILKHGKIAEGYK